MGYHYNGDEWRWQMRAPTHLPTITVHDVSDDALAEREKKIKAGARVVPFGFARALPQPEPPAPLVWEGDD